MNISDEISIEVFGKAGERESEQYRELLGEIQAEVIRGV